MFSGDFAQEETEAPYGPIPATVVEVHGKIWRLLAPAQPGDGSVSPRSHISLCGWGLSAPRGLEAVSRRPDIDASACHTELGLWRRRFISSFSFRPEHHACLSIYTGNTATQAGDASFPPSFKGPCPQPPGVSPLPDPLGLRGIL